MNLSKIHSINVFRPIIVKKMAMMFFTAPIGNCVIIEAIDKQYSRLFEFNFASVQLDIFYCDMFQEEKFIAP